MHQVGLVRDQTPAASHGWFLKETSVNKLVWFSRETAKSRNVWSREQKWRAECHIYGHM
jgi:hypothetical protein